MTSAIIRTGITTVQALGESPKTAPRMTRTFDNFSL
jgi:hypothetical protein